MPPARSEPGRVRSPRPLPAGRPTLRRRAWNALFVGASGLAAFVVMVPLALIVWHLLAKGLPALSLGFFVHLPKPVGEPGGGMANAIVGTLILVGIATLIAVPVGVGAGVWLAEFGRGRLAAAVRYTADVMSGVPSIVVGVAVYGLVVVPMGRFSALAGGVALALLMLPTIIRSTEEVVRLVPRSYREAALALGAPHWRTTQDVVIPAASAGIVTSCLLALARASGETAPLLFTALGNRFWSLRVDQPMASLPVFIYDYARAPYDDWNRQAWTGALVLLMLVTLLSALVRITTRRGPRP
jgi:phosphate transport system permease protein